MRGYLTDWRDEGRVRRNGICAIGEGEVEGK
jgi:hypothetical protein